MKMSDYFTDNKGGTNTVGSVGADVYQDIDHNMIDIVGKFESEEKAKAAAFAIKNHDKLVDLNYRLAEALDLILNKKIACDLGREGINVYKLLAECGIERG